MKEIVLTKGFVALVDDDEFEELNKYKWQAVMRGNKRLIYAVRSIHIKGTTNGAKHPYMHRILLNPPKEMQIDHINGNTLDNRKENLRIVTSRQNKQNLHFKKSSSYPGVSFNKSISQWRSMIRWNGKQRYLGDFKNEIDAATTYQVACAVLVNGK
jgi:hypothetical protein